MRAFIIALTVAFAAPAFAKQRVALDAPPQYAQAMNFALAMRNVTDTVRARLEFRRFLRSDDGARKLRKYELTRRDRRTANWLAVGVARQPIDRETVLRWAKAGILPAYLR